MIVALFGSGVLELLGGWDEALQTLVIFMAVDWFTGGIILPVVFKKSPKSGNGALESRAGWKGLREILHIQRRQPFLPECCGV